MNKWQPIATAPKDGTVILLCVNKKGYKEFYHASWSQVEFDSEYWKTTERYGWCIEHGDNADCQKEVDSIPTSWSPIDTEGAF